MTDLLSAERRALRARAHSLDPVVIIGNDGLTPGVIAEVERSLKAHELIKIRIGGMDHTEREAACEAICVQTGAVTVQHIGKIAVIYRKRPQEESKIALRKPQKKAPTPGASRRIKPSPGRSTFNAGTPRSPGTRPRRSPRG